MSSILDLALGIMSALGGFVDIGELVFTVQGGARFGYMLIWVVVVGTIGIIVYGEMAGRIAAVAQAEKQRLESFSQPGAGKLHYVMTLAVSNGNWLTFA